MNDVDGIITDQKRVADSFNRYFTNIANTLVSKLGKPNTKYQDYLKNPNENTFFLGGIDPGELKLLISKLDSNKSGDIYGITPSLVKAGCEELLPILTHLYNKTFEEGIFPSVLKYAKVVPIHKGESKFIMSNYRPIALLPILGKILEKLMHSRLYTFLTRCKILYPGQYGFQKGKSTEQAFFDIQHKIVSSLESKDIPCAIFLDFAKAFDTVDKDILLNKLKHYGIRGKAHDWLSSYLTGRKQCVYVNGNLSEDLPIDTGVPQGSILGPLLFLIYINDLAQSSNILKFVMFADDTCIFAANKNPQVLTKILSDELPKVSDWLIANKLSLNIKKTNFIVFKKKKTKI